MSNLILFGITFSLALLLNYHLVNGFWFLNQIAKNRGSFYDSLSSYEDVIQNKTKNSHTFGENSMWNHQNTPLCRNSTCEILSVVLKCTWFGFLVMFVAYWMPISTNSFLLSYNFLVSVVVDKTKLFFINFSFCWVTNAFIYLSLTFCYNGDWRRYNDVLNYH